MLISDLNIEIALASIEGAEHLTFSEPDRWSVISIRGARERKAHHPRARDVAYFLFDDVIRDSGSGMILPAPKHASEVFAAIKRFKGSPLLVHCAYGISRSPAVVLATLYWNARNSNVPDPITCSLQWLKEIGGANKLRPNLRLSRMLIELIEPEQPRPFERFRNHPLWPFKPEPDFYSQVLPNAKGTQP